MTINPPGGHTMTDTNRTEIARLIDGEPMLGAAGMSLLFGVTEAEAKQLRVDHGTTHLPADWIKRGRRRAKEAKRWGADESMLGALAYWAAKDLDAQLVEDTDGTVWAVSA